MITVRSLLSLTCAVALCVVGCRRSTQVDKANAEKILLVGIGPDPESLDPHLTMSVSGQNVLRATFEGLVTPDPHTLEPRPGVASSWEVSPDGLVYTFHIDPEARWSNGDSVSAHDFVFSVRRVLNRSLGATVDNVLVIAGAKDFYEESVSFDRVGIKAPDDRTLQITLELPTPYFLSLLAMPIFYPVHAPTLERFDGVCTRNNTWTKTGNIVSNGPFVFEHYVVGREIVVRKNRYYRGARDVHLNGIKFLPISDASTEERAFRNGQLHITEIVPYERLVAYAKDKDPALKLTPYLFSFYYLINVHEKPLDNVDVRRALALSIDREALAGTDQMRVKHRSARHFVPENCGGFTSLAPIDENVARARALLARAGYPNGVGFPTVELCFNTSEGQNFLGAAIQEMWRKNLGIDVRLLNQEWKVYLNTRRQRKFQLARGGWVGDYNDPTTFLDLFRSTSTNNFVGWSNADYDQLLEQATRTTDIAERLSLLQRAEAILLENMPIIPIHFSNSSHLVHPSVRNWTNNILDRHLYHLLDVSP